MLHPLHEIRNISKEELRNIGFRNYLGFFTDAEQREQYRRLHLSILLSDYAEATVKIVFNSIDGYRQVKTAIWGATEKYIILTGGSYIPVEAVASVSLDQ